MKRKDYIAPTMCVVKLKQHGQLLSVSGLGASRAGYDYNDDYEDTWE